eukprot:s653_g5.t1
MLALQRPEEAPFMAGCRGAQCIQGFVQRLRRRRVERLAARASESLFSISENRRPSEVDLALTSSDSDRLVAGVARTIYRHVAEGESRLPTEGHAFKPGSPGAAKRGPSAPLRAADFDEELFLERPNCSRKFSLKRFLRRFRRKTLADEIYELLKQVSALTEFKKEMAIISIIYIERLLKRHPTLCLTKGNWRPVLVAALHLASKTWEAGPDRTVTVHCLAGSSCELHVNSAETGREVAERIAAEVGHPAGLLVLTCGGCVIDQCQLLLRQVQHDEISYVVRKLGAGRVAMLWERLLEEQTLPNVDAAALNETMSLGWESPQELNQGMQLPSSLQTLTFGNRFNQSLAGIQLPSSLQSLTFGFDFNQSLEGLQLPSSMQSLTFGNRFNQSLAGIQLPSSLQSLTFGHDFNQSLEGLQLPSSLQSLTFGNRFNQSLAGIQLPSSLQSLTFGHDFNQRLDGIQLPSSLNSLEFGCCFDQSMDGIQLPSSLQSLTFGHDFNQSLEGIQLPSSLQSLTFGVEFDQSLEGIQLPSSLRRLKFGYTFNQSLEDIQLPSSLQRLTFGDRFNQSLEGIQLPSSLQKLRFGWKFNQSLEGIQLPSSLQSLTFGKEFKQSLEGIQLPSSLQNLTFGDEFNQSLEGIQLPSSLQSLTFGAEFDQSLEGIQLPSSLQSLTFGRMFNKILDGIQLPSGLQSLTFGRMFQQTLEGIQLPSSLRRLKFGYTFNQSLEDIQLPSSLQRLTFGYRFNQSLEGIQLPSSLQKLRFGRKFNQSLEGIQLPSSLQSLTFGEEFKQSLEGIQLPSSLQTLRVRQSLEGIQDVHAWNADFANYLQVVLGLRYPVRNLHQLEVKMLMGLDYHMEVCGELYASYYFALTEDLRASQTSAGRGNDSLLASSLGLCPSTLEGNSTLASERDRSSNPGSPTPSSASSQRATWNRSLLSSVKARRMSRTSSQATFLNSLSPQDEVPDAQSGFCPVRLDAVNPYVGYFRHAPRAQAPSTYLAIASDGLAGTLPTRPTRTKSAAELLRS